MARQLCCRGMCKNLLRSDGQQRSYGKAKFPSYLNCGLKTVSETGPWLPWLWYIYIYIYIYIFIYIYICLSPPLPLQSVGPALSCAGVCYHLTNNCISWNQWHDTVNSLAPRRCSCNRYLSSYIKNGQLEHFQWICPRVNTTRPHRWLSKLVQVMAWFHLARARPAVPLGLWSITSSLRGNFYVPRLHKFIKWFADNDVAHRN